MRRGEKIQRATAAAGRRANRATAIAGLVVIAIIVALTALLSIAFISLNSLYANSRGSAAIVLRPHALMWIMIAVPIAISSGILTYDAIIQTLIGPPPPTLSVEYIIASGKIPRWLQLGARVLASMFLIIAIFNLPYHVRITETAIYDQRPGDWKEQELRYSEVASVLLARYYIQPSKYSRGGPSTERRLFLRLRDESTWTLVNTFIRANAEASTAAALYIAERSGISVLYPDSVLGTPSAEERSAIRRRELVGLAILTLVFWFGNRWLMRGNVTASK